jgi:predicted molibdopterin-dependent oxidoreductase YjgC
MKGMKDVPSSCRMCFVEIVGIDAPVASCSVTVREGMVVKTDTDAVRRLQLTGLRLILSTHHVECAKCPANKRCELQRIAKLLKTGLKPKQFNKHLKEVEIDDSHPNLRYYANRCILCGRCLNVCIRKNDRPMMTYAKRGLDTVISFYGGDEIPDLSCENCLACIDVCPVAALLRKDQVNIQP